VLRGHPRLLWFPLLSLASVIGLILIVGPILSPGDGDTPWLLILVTTAIFYMAHVFFAVALTSEALKALRGESTSITSGLATATTRLHSIATFAAITGTFGFALGTIGRSRHVAVKIARSVVGTAWSLATYLAIPVMVQERRGGFTSLKRSSDLFRRTWGETTLSEVGVRVVTAHLGLLLALIAFALIDLLGDSFGILVVFALIVAAFAVIGTLEAIYRSALYVFAAEGVIPEPFDSPELEAVWRVK
jgi:hypothetical protein